MEYGGGEGLVLSIGVKGFEQTPTDMRRVFRTSLSLPGSRKGCHNRVDHLPPSSFGSWSRDVIIITMYVLRIIMLIAIIQGDHSLVQVAPDKGPSTKLVVSK